MHQAATWYGARGLCVRWGSSPLPKKGGGAPPQFSANFYCAQTAGCITMPLAMEVGLSPGDFVLDGMGTQSTVHKKGRSPQFSSHVYCGRTAPWIKMPDAAWHRGRRRPTRHCVTWGPSSPALKSTAPQFSVIVRSGQTAGWTKMPLGMEVGLGPGDFVFDGDPATSRKKHTHPTQFLAHVYCGQTAGWMKTPLGTEV